MEYKLVSYEDERISFSINDKNEMDVSYKIHTNDLLEIEYALKFSSLVVKEICKALNSLNSNQPENNR